MLRENGTTRLNVVSRSAGPVDPFLQAVQEAAADDFSVLGEIGRGADGVIIYLARENASQRLVALRLQREGAMADEYGLELVRHLDNSMPAPDSKCFKCGASVTGWARFCSSCGSDLSGSAPASDDATERALMLEAVKEAVAGQYDVLGEMSRNEGGGAVYFARDPATNKIVALRLQREGASDEFSLGLTTALKPIARSLGVKSGATQALSGMKRPPARPPAATSSPNTPAAPRARPGPPPPPPSGKRKSPAPAFIVGGIALLAIIAAIVLFTLPRTETQVPLPAPDTVATAVETPSAATDTQPITAAVPDTPSRPSAEPVTPAKAGASDRAAEPSKPATVRIGSLPSGAVLQVDGKPQRGSTLSLSAGTHQLAISAPGYESHSETLRLRAGETIAWSPSLTRTQAPQPAAPTKPATPPASACATDVKAEDWKNAFHSCMTEALAGRTAAKRDLAMLYMKGRGTPRNEQSGAAYYELAANEGDKTSMLAIADAYEHGDGVKKDEAKALSWYTKAANAGVMDAQSKLGEVYEKGRLGVKKDKSAALGWYRKAAAQGDKDAADKAEDLAKDLAK
jgi:hypothetical protein